MTLKDIENLKKETLSVVDVCTCLEGDPLAFRIQARTDPAVLGFPVIIIGNRIKIPKQAFLKFMRGELNCGQASQDGQVS